MIEEAQVSRQMYYQLEERALRAMLLALTPGASEPKATEPAKRIEELEGEGGVARGGQAPGGAVALADPQGAQRPDEVGSGSSEKEFPASASSTNAQNGRVSHRRRGLTPSTSVPSSTPTPDGESGA